MLMVTQRNSHAKKVVAARATMHRIGMKLLQEKKIEIMQIYGEKDTGTVEKRNVQGRDLLALLIKANMAIDIPADQRLADEEVLARTFSPLLAAYLSLDGPIQRYLRSSLRATRRRAHRRPGVCMHSASTPRCSSGCVTNFWLSRPTHRRWRS